MKRIILLFLFSLPATVLAAEQHFYNFGGVDTYQDSILIDDKDAISATNVLTDEGDLRSIYGNTLYATVATSSITFLKEWINSAGQRVLFTKAGLSLYATDPTSGTITNISTFTGERDLDMVAAFNKAYFVDGTAYPFYSVGTTTTAASGMEDCNLVELYQNRLACINTSTESSKVYLSWYNEPSSWTVTTNADSAAIKYFLKDDGEPINCAFTTPEGLFVGKDTKVGMLKGDDNENFYWYYISGDVGCVDDRLVRLVDGELVWLSKEGYYAYDFSGAPRPISKKVKPYTDKIRQSQSADSSWTTNTEAGWKLGTYTGWDTGINPGSIKSLSYNSGSTTTFAAAVVRVSTNAGFNDGTKGGWIGWPLSADVDTGIVAAALEGERVGAGWAFTSSCNLYDCSSIVSVLKNSDSSIVSSENVLPAIGKCSYKTFTGITTAEEVKLAWAWPATTMGVAVATITSAGFTADQGKASVKVCRSSAHYLYYDVYDSSSVFVSTWSASFDSGLSTITAYTQDLNGTNISVDLQYSADNVSFSSTAVPNRYVKYRVNFSSGVAVSSFTDLTLSYLSTAAYRSAVKFTALDIATWKLFSVSDSAGGDSAIYEIRAASFAFAAADTLPAFTTQTKNSNITIGTNTYVQYLIDPNVSSSTGTVTVNSVSIGYSVGSAAPRPASTVDDHRYIASVSSNSSEYNDLTFIWQKNKEWVFTDQTYGAMDVFNGRAIAGSTTTTSKLWYILDTTAKSFDGTTINSEWTTKDFTWGVPNHKRMDRFWIMADSGGVDDFGVAWQKDRLGTWTSTTTALNASTFIVREVEHMYDSPAVGRQFRFKFSAGELEKVFRLKLYSIYYTINPLIK
jgi:hypothetical protein